MADPKAPAGAGARRAVELVPRLEKQGYGQEDVALRRAWVEERTGADLIHVSRGSLSSEEMRGNVENPIGTVQMPLGVAGPLLIRGEHAQGTFYVPLATTEGALVRSYERGMVALTRAGGVIVRILEDENRVAPVFVLPDVGAAVDFARRVPDMLEDLQREAAATTSHGRLLRVICHPVGREVIAELRFHTADAQGMNMIVKAADRICHFLVERTDAERYLVFSGYNGEKRPAGSLLAGGKGKRVVAGALIPRRTVRAVLRTTPEALVDMWRHTVVGHLQSGSLGYNGHYANGLTALFIACGQDVANVVNAAVGITSFELTRDGDVHASVTLPSITVATVGGGTGLGTSAECLAMLGCAGAGKAKKLAEIVGATLLAGDLSMGAAIASGEFVAAHEAYGRNRPPSPPPPGES